MGQEQIAREREREREREKRERERERERETYGLTDKLFIIISSEALQMHVLRFIEVRATTWLIGGT